MSRNKDIKLLHDFTGAPYSVCRRKMKECHWDLYKAIGFDSVLDKLRDNVGFKTYCENAAKLLNDLADSMSKIIDDVVNAFSSIDWELVLKELKEANNGQERSDRLLDP